MPVTWALSRKCEPYALASGYVGGTRQEITPRLAPTAPYNLPSH